MEILAGRNSEHVSRRGTRRNIWEILLQFGRGRQGYQSRRKASEQTWARARHGGEVRHIKQWAAGPGQGEETWTLALKNHRFDGLAGFVGFVDGEKAGVWSAASVKAAGDMSRIAAKKICRNFEA